MNGDSTPVPPHWGEWPPQPANRAERRSCAKQQHEGAIKAGYCALCGTKVA